MNTISWSGRIDGYTADDYAYLDQHDIVVVAQFVNNYQTDFQIAAARRINAGRPDAYVYFGATGHDMKFFSKWGKYSLLTADGKMVRHIANSRFMVDLRVDEYRLKAIDFMKHATENCHGIAWDVANITHADEPITVDGTNTTMGATFSQQTIDQLGQALIQFARECRDADIKILANCQQRDWRKNRNYPLWDLVHMRHGERWGIVPVNAVGDMMDVSIHGSCAATSNITPAEWDAMTFGQQQTKADYCLGLAMLADRPGFHFGFGWWTLPDDLRTAWPLPYRPGDIGDPTGPALWQTPTVCRRYFTNAYVEVDFRDQLAVVEVG